MLYTVKTIDAMIIIIIKVIDYDFSRLFFTRFLVVWNREEREWMNERRKVIFFANGSLISFLPSTKCATGCRCVRKLQVIPSG